MSWEERVEMGIEMRLVEWDWRMGVGMGLGWVWNGFEENEQEKEILGDDGDGFGHYQGRAILSFSSSLPWGGGVWASVKRERSILIGYEWDEGERNCFIRKNMWDEENIITVSGPLFYMVEWVRWGAPLLTLALSELKLERYHGIIFIHFLPSPISDFVLTLRNKDHLFETIEREWGGRLYSQFACPSNKKLGGYDWMPTRFSVRRS
jgi:hypothetical protein